MISKLRLFNLKKANQALDFDEKWNDRTHRTRRCILGIAFTILFLVAFSGSANSRADVPLNLELSEQFGSSSLDQNLWVEYENGSSNTAGAIGMGQGAVRIIDGQLNFDSSNLNYFSDRVVSRQKFSRSNSDLSIKLDITVSDCARTSGFAFASGSNSTLDANDIFVHTTPSGSDSFWTLTSSSVDIPTTIKCVKDFPTSLELVLLSGGGAQLYVNNAVTPSAIGSSPKSWNLKSIVLGGNTTTGLSSRITKYDNILIRNNAPVDATVTSVEEVSANSARVSWAINEADMSSAIGRSSAAISYIVYSRLKGQSEWVERGEFDSALSSGVISLEGPFSNYEFRVASRNATGISLSKEVVYHIISSGQSLSMGWTSGEIPVPLSTSQPFKNIMLDSYSAPSAFIPLVEPARGSYSDNSGVSLRVESISSGMANTLTSLNGSRFLVSIHSIGGTAYAGLKKGTSKYIEAIDTVRNARALLNNQGLEYKPLALTIVHGENDERAGATAEVYAEYLREWQHDYETDVSSALGKSVHLPLFTTQMTSFGQYNYPSSPNVPLGQLLASRNQPNDIYLVTPNYIFEYSDGVHLRASSYRRMGEYFGKVMNTVLFQNKEWKPLQPTKVLIRDNVITAKFHVPEGKLEFDTSMVKEALNYGFDFSDSTNSASILNKSDVRIVGDDTVQITLSNVPTGSNPRLGYARKYTIGKFSGAQVSGAPRGNLRDTDPATAFSGTGFPDWMSNHLYNWSVVFNEPVQVGRRINFDLDGALGIAPTQSDLATGDTFKLPTTEFYKFGFNFKGWKSADGTSYSPGDTVTVGPSDLVLTANFEQQPLRSVTYNANGGGIAPPQLSIRAGSTFTLSEGPNRNAYSFSGWSDGKDVYASGSTYTVGSEDVVLTAQWTPNRLYVTFDRDNGEADAHVDVYAGASLDAPADPSKPGYVFEGWYTAPSGGARLSFPYCMGEVSGLTFYARWIAQEYRVVYHSYGSTNGSAPSDQILSTGQDFIVADQNTLAKSGYAFLGWTSSRTGEGTNYGVGDSVKIPIGGLQLFPRWAPQQQRIIYKGNGASSGSAPVDSIGFTDETILIATNAGHLEKSGFTFRGWNTSAQGTGRSFAPGSKYQVEAGGLTLYAVWNEVASVIGEGSEAKPTTPKPNVLYLPSLPKNPVVKTGPQVMFGQFAAKVIAKTQSNVVAATSTLVLQAEATGSRENAFVSLTVPFVSNSSIKNSIIKVQPGALISVKGDSALPGSRVDAYVFSRPKFIGAAIADSKGNYSFDLNLPQDLALGEHTLQLGVVSAESKLMVLSTPMRVKAPVFSAYFAYGSRVLPKLQETRLEEYVAHHRFPASRLSVWVKGYSPNSATLGVLRAKSVTDYLKKIGLRAKYVLTGLATNKFRDKDRRADIEFRFGE